jgi:hypothetical protein
MRISGSRDFLGKQTEANHALVKAVGFQAIHFYDKKARRPDGETGSEIVLIYALGEDGVIREFSGGKWTPFPIP